MSPQGPLYAGTAADGGALSGHSANTWSNVTNAEGAPSGSFASVSFTGSAYSDYLNLTGFNFNIPQTAIIDGIQVTFSRKVTGGGSATTNSIQLLKAGTAVGTPYGSFWTAGAPTGTVYDNWPSSASPITYGSTAYLWGTSWLYSDINNANFGVQISVNGSGGGAAGNIEGIGITVYWHTGPASVPLEYTYKTYSPSGQYLGNLPSVVSPFTISQDINTTGTTLPVVCAVSADTSALPVSNLTDESGNQLTDESGNSLTSDGQPPIVSLGTGPQALVQNGNRVQVWEYSYWHPNGVCVFKGEIQRWEASFGGGGAGSGGAATSDTSSHTVQLLLYSDGSDLGNYMVLNQPTVDQSQTATNATYGVNFSTNFPPPGQQIVPGAGVTGVASISLRLAAVTNDNPVVTVNLYARGNGLSNFARYAANGAPDITASQIITSTTPGVYNFVFEYTFPATFSQYYIFSVTCSDPTGVELSYDTSNSVYPVGSIIGVNGGNGAMYFQTYANSQETNPTFTSVDPANMLLCAATNYGGNIAVSGPNVQATGLSVSYEFNTNTVLEVIQAVQQVSPPNFYYYVSLGTSTLYFLEANTVPDVTFTKGVHLEQVTIIGSIENIINTAFFTGGVPSGQTASIYTTYTDANSVALYGPHLDRPTDANVTDSGTGSIVAYEDVQTQKNEQNQTTITVMYPTYDIASLRPGLMVSFNGFGSFIDNLFLQIVRVDRTPEMATLTLGSLPKRLIPSVEEVVRGLIGAQTVTNPSTPGFSL